MDLVGVETEDSLTVISGDRPVSRRWTVPRDPVYGEGTLRVLGVFSVGRFGNCGGELGSGPCLSMTI